MKLLVQQSTSLFPIKSLLHLQNLWVNAVILSLPTGFVSFHKDPRPYILFLWVTFPVSPVILFLLDCNFCWTKTVKAVSCLLSVVIQAGLMMMCFSQDDHIGLYFRSNTTARNRFFFSEQCLWSIFVVSKPSSPHLSVSLQVQIFKR